MSSPRRKSQADSGVLRGKNGHEGCLSVLARLDIVVANIGSRVSSRGMEWCLGELVYFPISGVSLPGPPCHFPRGISDGGQPGDS